MTDDLVHVRHLDRHRHFDMSAMPGKSPDEDGALTRWRARTLAAAGFDDGLARQLAATADVDLHELLVLVDRGCPPHLAARILAPLDRERP